MKNHLLVILSIFLFSSAAFAQGEYFGHGNSGFGPILSMAFSDDNSAAGFGFGVSNKGIIDFNLSYSSTSVKTSYNRTSTENAFSIGMNAHLVNKQHNPFKFSFAFGVSFLKNTHIFSAMPLVHLDARLSNSFFLKLYGGAGIGFQSEKDYYPTNSSYHGNSVLQGGLSFYTNSDNRQVFVFDIGVSNYKESTTLSVGFGMFFGSKSNNPLPEPRVLTEEEKKEAKKKRKSGYYGG